MSKQRDVGVEMAPTVANLFRYESLPRSTDPTTHSFRLLQLMPGSPDDPIVCCLQIYSSSEAPPYDALSYCWGDQSIKHKILCNNDAFWATTSVLDAFVQLRRTDETRNLWIDQICIDQNNLAERSYQVSVMRQIYSKATNTIIWLGPTNSSTGILFSFIPRLADIYEQLVAENGHKRYANNDRILERYGLKTEDTRTLIKAFARMIEQPWFERVWIVQEVVVSQSPIVVQGCYEVSWKEFVAAVRLVWDQLVDPFAIVIGTPVVRGRQNSSNVWIMEDLRKGFDKHSTRQLRILAGFFRHAKSTDPRDKLYALVGISDDAQSVSNNISMLSYHYSVSDAFRTWAVYVLKNEKSLEILSAVNRDRSRRSVIAYSWVPDWDCANDKNDYLGIFWPSKHFHVSDSPDIQIDFRDEEKVLGVAGHLLERIEEIGLPMCEELDSKIFGSRSFYRAAYFQQVQRSWEATARLWDGQTYRGSTESLKDAFWRTLVADQYNPQEEEHIRAEFDDYIYSLRRPFRFAGQFGPIWSRYLFIVIILLITTLRVTRVFGRSERGKAQRFSRRTRDTSFRRMIRTETDYIGLAVSTAQKGDYVCLFKGARRPFIVRPLKDGWQLVGDCHIHGLMYGEGWRPEKCEMLWLY